MLGNVFAKLFQAQRKPMMMSVLAISNLCALYLAYLLLSLQFEEFSIAMAITLASFFSLFIGYLVFRYSDLTKP